MLYEMRSYILKPGMVGEFEKRFADALPTREKYSKLGAFWHTELGPLNEVIHVWPYEDLKQREEVREAASKDPSGNWPPKSEGMILNMHSEVMVPAPFMRPLGNQKLGDIYEMRIYTYQPGTIPEVIKRWSEVIATREEYSPLAACWYPDLGALNRWYHVWPYRDLEHRNQVRIEASKNDKWPAPTREFMLSQEVKILAPAAFSPMH
jgi:hypothetical protein